MSYPASAVALYRRVLRSLRQFDDPGKKWYYRNWTRNNIATFNDEDDPERLQQLLQKGEEHRVWIMKKYHLKDIPGNR
ncbi:Complex 1 LYR protein [Nannochloropsis gaditana]|uniref:Complex 1 LYR protein n=1 Tax=Nannochloropsis gaditana TaxID=72520 RepID=W7UB97_9STRA|nr:Complex 1 LYR protein [Nannochloropsis gaditana]